MKSRSLLIKKLASNFCKEFDKLAPEFELKDRIVFTECLIELLAIRNQMKVNESRFQKIIRSTKFKNFNISATQNLLSYFDRGGVLMNKGISDTDINLVSSAEFEAMPNAEEQTLTMKEFKHMSWYVNNALNDDLIRFRTEQHSEKRKAERASNYEYEDNPSFYAKNKTKIFAFIYFYLHASKEEPIFEKFDGGKVKAIETLASKHEFSAKNFRNNYNILAQRGYNFITPKNRFFIKCASNWLLKNEYENARQIAETDYHSVIKLG